MKNIVYKLYKNRYFLLFIMIYGYLHTVYIRLWANQPINFYMFTPEGMFVALIQSTIMYVVIINLLKWLPTTDVFQAKKIIQLLCLATASHLLIIELFMFIISVLFGTVENNYNTKAFLFQIFTNLIDGFTYGSFLLVYYFYNKNKIHQQQVASYNNALSENKIYQLKAQLNPHFLFNNLNILDQLIEEDKQKASDFLNEFADIYRYVLESSDRKLIALADELVFIQQYFRLIQHKYGKAYQLEIDCKDTTGYVVPLALQLLIENAIQHNLGSESKPIYIIITIKESIWVSNNIINKRSNKLTQGRGLTNLNEQYKLLAKQSIIIHQNEQNFTAKIPIIETIFL